MKMFEHMQFGSALAALGVEVPDELVAIGAKWEAANNVRTVDPVGPLRANAANGGMSPDDLVAAIRDAAATLAAQEKIRSVVAEVDYPLGSAFGRIIFAHADGIVEQLRPAFDAHAAKLTDAAPLVPAGTTGEQVLAMGAAVVDAWHTLAQAAAGLDAIADVRTRLSSLYGYGDRGVELFIAPVPDADALQQARYAFRGAVDYQYTRGEARGGNWQHLVGAGFRLSLNTAAEAAAVIGGAPVAATPVGAA